LHPFVLENLEQRLCRIPFLRLPTYAPWTNPSEKLWLKLSQELLDRHEFGNDWKGLQQAIDEWLASFAQGSASLLHFVGLSP
jgi:transposase